MNQTDLGDRQQQVAASKTQPGSPTPGPVSRILNQHFGVIITCIVAAVAVYVSAQQVKVARLSLETSKLQKDKELELGQLDQDRRWKLDLAEYVSKNREAIFSGNIQERARIRSFLLVTFPPEVTQPLFDKLVVTADEEGKVVWQEAKKAVDAMVKARMESLSHSSEARDVIVQPGKQLTFAGTKGDTRILVEEYGDRSLDFYRGNDILFQIHNGYVVLPPCPSDTNSLPLGAMCTDVQEGKLLIRAYGITQK